ncbi:hypothetical protein N7539_002489 [Penicillium diatomitis]|uniref:Uncharacterized protein n=1 Tax=Penicillium diatomitis TaxID=2819901 RepID=A0A9W9XEY6_9EURO|nr:uncharacterized protein N7539_002489 [Penicillium diatomitis]KAJ5490922.1 hypothetical protein N7539_002489 [Penicillium diatomitis]
MFSDSPIPKILASGSLAWTRALRSRAGQHEALDVLRLGAHGPLDMAVAQFKTIPDSSLSVDMQSMGDDPTHFHPTRGS